MITLRNELHFTMTQTYTRLFLSAFAVAMAFVNSASAGLIGTTYSLRLDAHVKKNAATALERYAATPVFNASQSVVPGSILNVLNGTVNPANTSVDVTESDAANKVVIWVSNSSQPIFANTLDSAFPIEFEADLHWDDLAPNQKIVPSSFDLENGLFYQPVSSSFTGTGSLADPLKIVLKFNTSAINPSEFNFNIAKFRFEYTRMTNVVPEPTTCALMMLTLGLCGIATRRRA